MVLDGIEKRFGPNRVLRGIDLRVHAGEIFTHPHAMLNVCRVHEIPVFAPIVHVSFVGSAERTNSR